jgi:hypothetical protein
MTVLVQSAPYAVPSGSKSFSLQFSSRCVRTNWSIHVYINNTDTTIGDTDVSQSNYSILHKDFILKMLVQQCM